MLMEIKKENEYAVIEGVRIDNLIPLPRHVLVRWLHKTETKGGIVLPQTRQRAGFMKGVVLAVGPDCDPSLVPGAMIEFNGLSEKEFLGPQDPADRDSVFFFREENVFGVVSYVDGKPVLDAVGDWVLMEPDAGPEKSQGLIVTQTQGEGVRRQSRSWSGTVLSMGSRVESCEPGDRVVYETYGATSLRLGDHNDRMAVMIHGIDVIAHLEKEEAVCGVN